MKNVVPKLIGAYLAIGLAIMAVQSAIVATQPECSGTASQPLWENGGRARPIVRWLPDLYTHVVRGDLGVAGYLRAGHVCTPLVMPNPFPPTTRLDLPRDGDGSLASRVLNSADGTKTISEERLPAYSFSVEQQRRLLEAADRSPEAALAEWQQIAPVDIGGATSRAATEQEVQRFVEALRRSNATDFGIATALSDRDDELPGKRIGWYREQSYQAAIDSVAAKKYFVMVIGDDWCDYCNDLVENVLRCPEVERFAGSALFAYGRPSRDPQSAASARDLGVTEYPAVFLAKVEEGTIWVHHQIVGAVTAGELAAKLRTFLGEPAATVADASLAARAPGFHADPQPMCR
jgi:hypothetical protein